MSTINGPALLGGAAVSQHHGAGMSKELNRAIMHAVNYHGLDARLNTPDWQIADLITGEVFKHLCGTTDVQIIERMTPEERARIGEPAPEPPGDIDFGRALSLIDHLMRGERNAADAAAFLHAHKFRRHCR